MKKNKPTCIHCKQISCTCPNRTSKTTLKGDMDEILAEIPEQIQLTKIKAQLCYAYYQELVKQGLKENQALELCKYYKVGE